jgi:hypothetical protein
MYLSSPPYVPHVLPISVFLTSSPEWYLVRSTEHKAPWYVQKISPSPEFDFLTVQPVTYRYTDWAIAVFLRSYILFLTENYRKPSSMEYQVGRQRSNLLQLTLKITLSLYRMFYKHFSLVNFPSNSLLNINQRVFLPNLWNLPLVWRSATEPSRGPSLSVGSGRYGCILGLMW